MKKIDFLLLFVAGISALAFLTGCHKDDPTTLTVSPNSLELLSDKGSSVSFNISSNATWSLSGLPDWISVSAISGTGNGTVIVTSLSANDSAEERIANITVTADDKSAVVNLKQRASLIANCKVGFKDLLTMTTSAAFKYDIDPNVSFFYAGYLSVNAAGWTDERIVNALMDEDRFDPNSAEDTGLQGFGGMNPGTDYYLCAVGFNDKGERGELTKMKITTLKEANHIPWILITDASYSSTQWKWTTEPNSYTSKYYMLFTDGLYADYYGLILTEAEIAWIIKDGISSGDVSPIARGGDWTGSRDNYEESLFIATWGMDTENNFSPMLNVFYATIDTNDVMKHNNETKGVRRNGISDVMVKELQHSVKIYEKQ
ncbi:MAG: BACON domain-containing protein [Muribaculum sp.]|nr:BACON domain-containing protein [Muribaculum sp.]